MKIDGVGLVLLALAVLALLIVRWNVGSTGRQLRDSEGHDIDPSELEGDEPEEWKDQTAERPQQQVPGRPWWWRGFGWWSGWRR